MRSRSLKTSRDRLVRENLGRLSSKNRKLVAGEPFLLIQLNHSGDPTDRELVSKTSRNSVRLRTPGRSTTSSEGNVHEHQDCKGPGAFITALLENRPGGNLLPV